MNGMTSIVKTVTKIVIGFIAIFAGSTILQGHLTPGGGFAGGVILACLFILIVLVYGKSAVLDIVSEKALSVWDSIGALCFLLIAAIGFAGGIFFKNIINRGAPLRLLSGGTVMWSNLSIGLKVTAGLSAVFLALVLFQKRKSNPEQSH